MVWGAGKFVVKTARVYRVKDYDYLHLQQTGLLKCKYNMFIFTTIGALFAKICPQNRTDFSPCIRNSTPIIANKFLRLHIASPRPLDRSLFAFVLCFFTTLNQKEF